MAAFPTFQLINYHMLNAVFYVISVNWFKLEFISKYVRERESGANSESELTNLDLKPENRRLKIR